MCNCSTNKENYQFCPNCGAPLTPQAAHARAACLAEESAVEAAKESGAAYDVIFDKAVRETSHNAWTIRERIVNPQHGIDRLLRDCNTWHVYSGLDMDVLEDILSTYGTLYPKFKKTPFTMKQAKGAMRSPGVTRLYNWGVLEVCGRHYGEERTFQDPYTGKPRKARSKVHLYRFTNEGHAIVKGLHSIVERAATIKLQQLDKERMYYHSLQKNAKKVQQNIDALAKMC